MQLSCTDKKNVIVKLSGKQEQLIHKVIVYDIEKLLS